MLMVMVGGIGGYVFLGFVVVYWMEVVGWCVVWFGNLVGMEVMFVLKYGILMEYVWFGGLCGKGLKIKLMLLVNLLCVCW